MADVSREPRGLHDLGIRAMLPAAAARRLEDGEHVFRFLRGRLAFRSRPDDVFISSYPRSGTTWLQMIVHVLLRDGDLSFEHISDAVPWFERSLALGRAQAADFERLESPRIFKSHLPRRWLPNGTRYIYAVRDGRDVAVSYYHFYRSHLAYQGGFDEFFERFQRGSLQYKSWYKHVAGWRRVASAPNTLMVEYEALAADLPAEMARIAGFLGHEVGAERIHELAELCDFDAMKQREALFDHASREPGLKSAQRGQFIRRGQRGEHRVHLTPDQQVAFERRLRQTRLCPDLELDIAAFLH